jgi:SAM-dependent methyltransferase
MNQADCFREIHSCRLCGSSALEDVVRLTDTPPANNLITADELGRDVLRIPLTVCRCDDCTHVQLRHVVAPSLLFSNYLYTSKTSPVMRAHLAAQARALVARNAHNPNRFVVEVGSNDGTLLLNFREHGCSVLGVDPAANIVAEANAAGARTIAAFFNEETGQRLAAEHGKAGLVCANHCFAHIQDIDSVVRGVKHLLDDEAEFVFEVGYLLDVVENTLFDTIYHEHLDYHHVKPLVRFFRKHGMSLVRVERHAIQGGALRGFARLGNVPADDSVAELLALEDAAGINDRETFQRFEASIQELAANLKAVLEGITAKGGKVCGFGVPAKATTMLYHFGINSALVHAIADENPLKQGRIIAGLGIPIIAPEELGPLKPDVLLIFAWNFAENIMARYHAFLEGGGRFMVALPELKMFSLEGTETWPDLTI